MRILKLTQRTEADLMKIREGQDRTALETGERIVADVRIPFARPRRLEIEETAEFVSAPAETVRSRLRLAKDRLRRELGEDHD